MPVFRSGKALEVRNPDPVALDGQRLIRVISGDTIDGGQSRVRAARTTRGLRKGCGYCVPEVLPERVNSCGDGRHDHAGTGERLTRDERIAFTYIVTCPSHPNEKLGSRFCAANSKEGASKPSGDCGMATVEEPAGHVFRVGNAGEDNSRIHGTVRNEGGGDPDEHRLQL